MLLCRAAGGKVSVQSVTEGKLYVTSESGPVKLGKIKATTARVNTAGKCLTPQTLTQWCQFSLKLQAGSENNAHVTVST